uniref:Secreted protein n=1 Tax=Pararge aegeria TaxID=116150 RepID=S4P8G9_9NEOP
MFVSRFILFFLHVFDVSSVPLSLSYPFCMLYEVSMCKNRVCDLFEQVNILLLLLFCLDTCRKYQFKQCY